ncbi:DUF177 domain-containing protein [Anaerolentibacter hominis]|uniref:YceD family protein n=1 Tax=Anaerolentibacter hominis TaxID=3079009 RepID=UPI0031B82D4C
MLICLSDFITGNSQIREWELPVEMEVFELNGTGYPVAEKEPLKLTVTRLGEHKVKIEGNARIVLQIPCSRCLEYVDMEFPVRVEEEVDLSETEEERTSNLDELSYITGYNLDAERLIYNEVLLQFPARVLCSEDCKGICKVCGTNLNKATCDCDQTVKDPRMAAFQNIFDQFKEV